MKRRKGWFESPASRTSLPEGRKRKTSAKPKAVKLDYENINNRGGFGLDEVTPVRVRA